VLAGNEGNDKGDELLAAATALFRFNKTTLRLTDSRAVAGNLPPVLANAIPNLPQLGSGRSFAVICSGASCQPPVFEAGELERALALAFK